MQPRHPIGVVAKRTGIDLHLLRAWERRYAAVVPARSATGRRLYTDHDVSRLRMLKRLVEGGRRISDVATLSLDALEAQVREDEAAAIPAAGQISRKTRRQAGEIVPAPPRGPAELLAEALAAIGDLDRTRLEQLLTEAAINLSAPRLREELLVPLLEAIGARWHEGTLRVVHEHLATEVLRTFLTALRPASRVSALAPRIVVATPVGELHEFGALLVTATAAESGWNVCYLGPNLPAEEIVAGARQHLARVVALSLVFPKHEPGLRDELRRLRQGLGPDIALLVGGRAAAHHAGVLAEAGAVLLPDLAALQDELLRLVA